MTDITELLARIAAVFVRHEVNFVVIGGWAVQAQGFDLGYETEDIDFTPDLHKDNLERIAAALEEIGAKTIRKGPGMDAPPDAHELAAAPFWNMTCEHGDFDLVFHPAGLNDYRQLRHSAHPVAVDVDGQQIIVPCADLADIVISKGFARRDKDRRSLPRLRAQLDQLHRREQSGLEPDLGP